MSTNTFVSSSNTPIFTSTFVKGYNRIATNVYLKDANLLRVACSDGSSISIDSDSFPLYADQQWQYGQVGTPVQAKTINRRVYFRAGVNYSHAGGIQTFGFVKKYNTIGVMNITAQMVGNVGHYATIKINVTSGRDILTMLH